MTRALTRIVALPLVLTLTLVVALGLTTPHPATDSNSDNRPDARQDEPQRVRYDGHRVVRANVTSQRELMTMLALSNDPWSERVGIGPVDFRLEPDAFAALQRTGIEFEVLIEDVQVLIDAERARIEAHQQQQQQGGVAGEAGWFEEFKTWEEVNAYLDELAALQPEITEIFEVGESIEGRVVRGIRIGTPSEGADKPAVLFNGCQHAREWISVMVTTYIADQLVRQYGIDPQITELVDDIDIYVIPVVNPDGYVYSWDFVRLWRKNRRDNGDGSFGVDPNRNWGFEWGGQGSSGNTGSETYRGPSPFSEPETANLRDFMLDRPEIVAHLDIHSYSQLILAPWGYTNSLPPDHDVFQEVGGTMADIVFSVHGVPYVHGPVGPTLYLASGNATDWAYGAADAFSFTYELRDTGQFGFILPPEQIIPNCEEIFPAVLYYTNWASTPVQFEIAGGAPEIVEADEPTAIEVSITPISSAVVPDSATLYTRIGDGGDFVPTSLNNVSDNLYEGVLPSASCGSTIHFYVEVETETAGTVRYPEDAPADTLQALAQTTTVVFADNFNDDLGWIAGAPDDDATSGLWERANPNGSNVNGTPVQPSDPFEGLACYITGQHPGGGAGANDVDNGKTTLFSPVLDLSDVDDSQQVRIGYWRWYSNALGASPNSDTFDVDISADGGETWTSVEVVGPAGPETLGGWFHHEFNVADFVPLTDQVQLRFIASDYDPQALIEAAVDVFTVRTVGCDTEPGIPGDLDGNDIIDGADLAILLCAWGPCSDCDDCDADLDDNCEVDGADLAILLGNWS